MRLNLEIHGIIEKIQRHVVVMWNSIFMDCINIILVLMPLFVKFQTTFVLGCAPFRKSRIIPDSAMTFTDFGHSVLPTKEVLSTVAIPSLTGGPGPILVLIQRPAAYYIDIVFNPGYSEVIILA
ncbi:hypothetical protein NQ315_009400, partial [Exocentrus adspersus]